MVKKDQTDSVNDMEARKARIRAEAEEIEQSQSEEEARQRQMRIDRDIATSEAEAKRLEYQVGLIHDGETREQLLDRIRSLREAPVVEPYVPPPLTPFMKEQLAIEQEAGRQGVARAEAAMAQNRENAERIEAERLAREGTMTTVQHPNPGMNEKFPTNKP